MSWTCNGVHRNAEPCHCHSALPPYHHVIMLGLLLRPNIRIASDAVAICRDMAQPASLTAMAS